MRPQSNQIVHHDQIINFLWLASAQQSIDKSLMWKICYQSAQRNFRMIRPTKKHFSFEDPATSRKACLKKLSRTVIASWSLILKMQVHTMSVDAPWKSKGSLMNQSVTITVYLNLILIMSTQHMLVVLVRTSEETFRRPSRTTPWPFRKTRSAQVHRLTTVDDFDSVI